MGWKSIAGNRMINETAQVTLCYTAAMRRRGKLDLEKIRASLNTPCPHCGHSITQEERTHVDTEHLECPQAGRDLSPARAIQAS